MRWTPSTPRRTRVCVYSFVVLMAAGTGGYAAQSLKTTTGRSFSDVRVLQVDPNGVTIRHKDGVAKVLFDDLSKSDRQKFRYNEDKARDYVNAKRGVVAVPESTGSGPGVPATDVNVNLRINVAAATAPQAVVWRIPYPYYRYPRSRGLWSNDYRPVVYRPYYPYNSYSYLYRQGLIRPGYAFAGCGNPFFMLAGGYPGLAGRGCRSGVVYCGPRWGGMSIEEQLLCFHQPFLRRWHSGIGGYW